MHERYLDILQLAPGASAAELKAAYRRLSKKYHPDVNKSAEAQARFVEIAEAYHFLSHAGTTPQVVETPATPPNEAYEYELWKASVREWAHKKAQEEARRQYELMAKLVRGFRYAGMVIFGFNLLLVLDYSLPRVAHDEEITAIYTKSEGGRRARRYYYDVIRTPNYQMLVDAGAAKRYDRGVTAQIIATSILDIPVTARIQIAGHYQSFHQAYGIYHVFGVIIPVVLLLLSLHFWVVHHTETRLTFILIVLVLFLIQLVVW